MDFEAQFTACENKEEARDLYRTLAKKHHPDLLGCVEAMKLLNSAYEAWTNKTFSGEALDVELEIARKLKELFETDLMTSVIIELIGEWIWISGDTKPVKEELKEMSFKWHFKRKMWFWHNGPSRRTYNKKASIGDLKSKYGCRGFSRTLANAS